MTKFALAVIAIASTLIATAVAECANGCNGHGKCTSYDMCICNRNWQANDCSERVCQFGLAHVDTPKGDLDASGSISGPNHGVVDNSFTYPYGTTEQYPQMEDSDLNPLSDSGHYYMECSNKGTCDRATGDCNCYDGYDGVACQRASCPGYPASCSGHGTCKTKKQLAKSDNFNVYQLWDKDTTMGCDCDAGYTGADCAERICKSGVDPLYLDDTATIKYSIYDFATLTTSTTIDFTNGFAQPTTGYWAIRFYDITGEDWVTAPIPAGATCSIIIAALEGIPNNVVPPGYTECSETRKSNTPENRWQSFDESDKVSRIQWVLGKSSGLTDCDSTCEAVGATCSASNPWSYLPTVTDQIVDLSTCVLPAVTSGNSNTVYDLKSCSYTSIVTTTQTASAEAAKTYAPYVSGTTAYKAYASGGSTCNAQAAASTQRFCPCTGTFWQPTVHPYQISYNMSIWEADSTSNNVADPVPITRFGGSGVTISAGSTATTALSGYIYRIKFFGNPGKLPEPQIEIYLDGKRPTLQSQTGITTGSGTLGNPTGKVITKVWTDGQQGESNDYFADHCSGVTVSIGFTTYGQYFLNGLTATEKALLKTCLGASDFDTSNNVETYNWDYGNKLYPHLVKLVRSVTVYTDGGYYAAIYYKPGTTGLDNTASPNGAQGAQGTFMLLHPFAPPDAFATDNYEVYTTKGTFALTSNASEATFSFASKSIFITNSSYDTNQGNGAVVTFDGDISCEIGNNNAYKTQWIFHCLNKSDIFTFLSWNHPEVNPPHLNLYTAERLYTKKFEYSVFDRFQPRNAAANTGKDKYEMHYMTHVINTDISTNWGASIASEQQYNIYKFFPATASKYNYVSECSNRGVCDTTSGVCKCFPGYTNDDCSVQNSISL